MKSLSSALGADNSEWNIITAPNQDSARQLAEQTPFNVVITDASKAGEESVPLLQSLSKRNPNQMMLILCNDSDVDWVSRNPGIAHQYLSNACSPEELRERVTRCLNLHSLLNGDSPHFCGGSRDILPSVPTTFVKLEEMLQSETSSIAEIADLISSDVALAAKVLHLVNTAFYGLARTVESVQDAIGLLGVETIKALTLTESVFSNYDVRDVAGISVQTIHDGCIRVGQTSQDISRFLSLDSHDSAHAFFAGLLHEVGLLLMLAHFPRQLETAIKIAQDEKTTIHHAEDLSFGINHSLIGGHLLALWRFPFGVVDAVAHYHAPLSSPTRERCALTAVHIAYELAKPDQELTLLRLKESSYLKGVGLQKADIEEICSTISEAEQTRQTSVR